MLALSSRELKLANTQEAREQFTPEQGLQYLLRTERGQEHARLAQGAWGGLWMGGHRGLGTLAELLCLTVQATSSPKHYHISSIPFSTGWQTLSLQEADSECFRLHGPRDHTHFLSQPLGSAAGGSGGLH